MLINVLEDDGKGKAFSEFVRSLARSGSIDSSHFGEKP